MFLLALFKVQNTSGAVSTYADLANCSSSSPTNHCKNQQEQNHSSQSKLKFVPRSVAISKRVVFHKKPT